MTGGVERHDTVDINRFYYESMDDVILKDLKTEMALNIWWKATKKDGGQYHTDWVPMTEADLAILQLIITAAGISPAGNGKGGNDLWEAREGLLTFPDGRQVYVGFHLYSHEDAIGGGLGGVWTGPEFGHFCMYHGDSTGDSWGVDNFNNAAKNAANSTTLH